MQKTATIKGFEGEYHSEHKMDRLEIIEKSLNSTTSPDTAYVLELVLAELQYLREQIEALKCSK